MARMASTNTDRDELRSVVRSLLERRSNDDVVRAFANGGEYDPALWRLLTEQVGLGGLLIPEEYGGQGAGLPEAVTVLEECGRALVPAPVLSSAILAPTVLAAAEDPDSAATYLPGIARGTSVVVVALDDAVDKETLAVEVDGGWRLRGEKVRVLDAGLGDTLLVVARTEDGRGVFAVDPADPRVDVRVQSGPDLTRREARVVFDDVEAQRIGADLGAGYEHLLAVARLASAAESVGVAAKMMEVAVDYAKSREQFGRLIGSFQAIKHLCAEMYVKVTCARSAVSAAAVALQAGTSEAGELVAIAKAYSSEAATSVVEQALQVHGGIGYTWEHVSHLYLRRAKWLELNFGSPHELRAELARKHGLVAA